MQPKYLAHSDKNNRTGFLREHLVSVATRAAEYANAFDSSEEAWIAGLLHDLGKYGDLFQERLKNPKKVHGIDHWSAGAWTAIDKYKHAGVASALVIQGHHLGLLKGDADSLRDISPQKLSESHPLGLRLSEKNLDTLIDRLRKEGLQIPESLDQSVYDVETRRKIPAAAMLDARMLYSALVDADFIETEAHFEAHSDGSKNYRKSGPPLEPEKALPILTSYLCNLSSRAVASTHVMDLRSDLLKVCLESASSTPGLFTLTAPTGSGKTLSMLAFALKHAKEYRLRRVVIVIPYLSIIEQTVEEYRNVFEMNFDSDYVLENHSLAGTRDEDGDCRGTGCDSTFGLHSKHLAENWDAPIVVTTSVQFLESLFSNRPSACRKLHRLANSVILFDEVQTLPVNLSVPTLATLSRLSERYKTTVVFATATQPAFGHLNTHVKELCDGGWQPLEIVPSRLMLFERAKRTRIKWPSLECATSWKELAARLSRQNQALCIVNLKAHAHRLFDELNDRRVRGLLHLSTNMCPAHRKVVLKEVRQKLKAGEPCLLVSTQCVEAGVDVDFPTVLRALGPMDAIAQAAGRCNRNGWAKTGTVTVFVPEDEGYPGAAYQQATSSTRALLTAYEQEHQQPDINDPQLFDKYYRDLYSFAQPEKLKKELIRAIRGQDFIAVAREYRVIENNSINVVVPYRTEEYNRLKTMAEEEGLTRKWIAMARPHTVGIYRPGRANAACWSNLLPVTVDRSREDSDDWFIYLNPEHYNSRKGLILPHNQCLIA